MALPRYERQRQVIAGPRTSRAILMAFGVAALVGLVIGVVWVIAGLVNYYFLR